MKKLCERKCWPVRLMPVPRALSSSCGVCVQYKSEAFCPAPDVPEEVEQIVRVTGMEELPYEPVYRAHGI